MMMMIDDDCDKGISLIDIHIPSFDVQLGHVLLAHLVRPHQIVSLIHVKVQPSFLSALILPDLLSMLLCMSTMIVRQRYKRTSVTFFACPKTFGVEEGMV